MEGIAAPVVSPASHSVRAGRYGTTCNYNPANGNLLLEVTAINQNNFLGGTNGNMEADDDGTVTSRAYVIGTGTTATGIDNR